MQLQFCQWRAFARPGVSQPGTAFSTMLLPHFMPRDDRGQTKPQARRVVWIILAAT